MQTSFAFILRPTFSRQFCLSSFNACLYISNHNHCICISLLKMLLLKLYHCIFDLYIDIEYIFFAATVISRCFSSTLLTILVLTFKQDAFSLACPWFDKAARNGRENKKGKKWRQWRRKGGRQLQQHSLPRPDCSDLFCSSCYWLHILN